MKRPGTMRHVLPHGPISSLAEYLCYVCLSVHRDGGLKRAKVKDTFKEEQQKNYSKMIVGNGSPNLELD